MVSFQHQKLLLKNQIEKAFESALVDWSVNESIRETNRYRLKKHYEQTVNR